MWAVWAVRVGHGLEPVKHCFSWQGREAGVGGVRAVKKYFSWQGRWRGEGQCERWGRRGQCGRYGRGAGGGGKCEWGR